MRNITNFSLVSFFSLPLFCIYIIFLSGCNRYQKPDQGTTYFQCIPTTSLSRSTGNYLALEIEDESIFAELDLGFDGAVSVPTEFAERIENKEFQRERTMCGIRGIKTHPQEFDIPKIWINGISITGSIPLLVENHDDSSHIFREGEKPKIPKEGLVGWWVFQKKCLFLNFAHHEVIVCNDLQTVQDRKQTFQEYISVPFSLEKGVIEFRISLNGKPHQCMLDNGASWNILNHPLENRSLEEVAYLPENSTVLNLEIGSYPFGEQEIRILPLKFPFHIDMILGMTFLQNHQVLIDFPNQMLYFATQKTSPN